MRLRLARLAVILSCLAFLAPAAASAETFNCFCQGADGQCKFVQPIEASSASASAAPCITVCEGKSQEYCRTVTPAADETKGGTCGGRTVCLTNPLNTASIPTLIGNILKAAIGIVGSLALLIFVYGGFLWLTSAGEAGKVEKGKEAMKWSIVGLAVVFSSYALVSFVLSALTK